MTTCEICRGTGTVVNVRHRPGDDWPIIEHLDCPACGRAAHEQGEESGVDCEERNGEVEDIFAAAQDFLP